MAEINILAVSIIIVITIIIWPILVEINILAITIIIVACWIKQIISYFIIRSIQNYHFNKKHYDEYRKLIAENRRIEKEMVAAHRAAEKAFAEQFTDAEKESLKLAKQAAGDSVKSFMSTLKAGERRLAGIVTVGYGASKKTVLALVRRGASSDADEVIDEVDADVEEDNGNIWYNSHEKMKRKGLLLWKHIL